MKKSFSLLLIICGILAVSAAAQVDPPASFDLRDVGGTSYVTPVKAKMVAC